MISVAMISVAEHTDLGANAHRTSIVGNITHDFSSDQSKWQRTLVQQLASCFTITPGRKIVTHVNKWARPFLVLGKT